MMALLRGSCLAVYPLVILRGLSRLLRPIRPYCGAQAPLGSFTWKLELPQMWRNVKATATAMLPRWQLGLLQVSTAITQNSTKEADAIETHMRRTGSKQEDQKHIVTMMVS